VEELGEQRCLLRSGPVREAEDVALDLKAAFADQVL